MKLSVAAPLVTLLTAFILALLALLAGIKHNFLPDAYIVRFSATLPTLPKCDGYYYIDVGRDGWPQMIWQHSGTSHVDHEYPGTHNNSTMSIISTMHFLTNCQWNFNDKAQECSEPWDFESLLGSGIFDKDDPDGMIHNRDAFSKVHLTGCVLVGLSFLCTAASFFILPAFGFGKWISIGNLALATLATIFLLTSSIFTAVLAKKTQGHLDKLEKLENLSFLKYYDVGPASKLQGFV